MKSNPNGRSWSPTSTLARLFEEQSQFFDALAAYEMIDQNESSPQVREKIEALHLRILSDPSAKYDARIEQLFSSEELAYLKILNHSAFGNLSTVAQKIAEGFPDTQNFLDSIDAEEFNESLDELQDMQAILQAIEEQALLCATQGDIPIAEHSVKDFLVAMLSRFPKDTPLAQISISDLMSIFIMMQQGLKEDSK